MKLTPKDINNCISSIKLAYKSQFTYTDSEMPQLAELWYNTFKGYPREIVLTAVNKAMQECEFMPTLSQICKRVKDIIQVDKKKAIDLWNEVEDTFTELAFISRDIGQPYSNSRAWDDYKQDFCGYTYEQRGRENLQKVFDKLPAEIKRYFGNRPERLLAFYRMEDKDQHFEKTRFINTLLELMANEEQKAENELNGFTQLLDDSETQALPDGDKEND